VASVEDLRVNYPPMANFKTNGTGPQVGKQNSHTFDKVSLMESGGDKNSLARKPPLKAINLSIGTYNIRTLRTVDRM